MPTSYQLLRAERNRKWFKDRDGIIERNFFHRGHRYSIERALERNLQSFPATPSFSNFKRPACDHRHYDALARQLHAILNPKLRFRLESIETGWFDSAPIAWRPLFSDPDVEVLMLMKFSGRKL